MAKITFILGGARSGKSTYALELAKNSGVSVAFIATCQGLDKEMASRIASHKGSRPGHWRTFEEPRDIGKILEKINGKFECVIIDCMTLLVSNLMLAGYDRDLIEKRIGDMMKALKNINAKTIIVSNEVGLGIVPKNKLGRDFRDIAGRINQIVAGKADEVIFMVSGIPAKIKGRR